MMMHAGIYENLNTGLWPKFAGTVTKLKNVMVNPHKTKCAYENFYGEIPDYAKILSNFEEMGAVRSIATIIVKLEY